MREFDWEKLYKDNYRAVYWTCLSFMKNKDDAEDITQNVFITAFEKLNDFEDEAKASSWLRTVAAHKCLDVLKLRRTVSLDERMEDEEMGEFSEPVDENFLPDEYAIDEEKRKIVMDIVRKSLTQEQYLTVIMFYFDEMSISDIAKAMGVPEGTIKSRLNTSRRKIKEGVEMYEKKNDKIYAAVPFLSLLLQKQAMAEIPTIPPMPSAFVKQIPSPKSNLTVNQAAKGMAKTAGKEGMKMISKKAIIAAVAVVAVGTAGVITTKVIHDKKEEKNVEITTLNEEQQLESKENQSTEVTGNGGEQSAASMESGATVEPVSYLIADDDSVSLERKLNAVVTCYLQKDQFEYKRLSEKTNFRFEYDNTENILKLDKLVPTYLKMDASEFWASDEEMLNDSQYQYYVEPIGRLVSLHQEGDQVTIYYSVQRTFTPESGAACIKSKMMVEAARDTSVEHISDPDEFVRNLDAEKRKEMFDDYVESAYMYSGAPLMYYKVTYTLQGNFLKDEDFDDLVTKLMDFETGEEVTQEEAWQYNVKNEFMPDGSPNPNYQKDY